MGEIATTFTAVETAAYLGVCYETVIRMARRQQIPHHRIGRKLLFRKDSLDQWIQGQEQRSTMSEIVPQGLRRIG